MEYAYDSAKLAHESGLKNIFVTSGFETKKTLETMRPYLDGMNIDLKSFSDEFYRVLCGARLNPVLETIRHAKELGIWVEITSLLIPGYNDGDEEIRQMAAFVHGVDPMMPWHISAFHPTYRLTDAPRTPKSTLERAYAIGKEAGLAYVYVGNVADEDRSSTYCPKCGYRVLDRRGHLGEIVVNHLEKGACPKCRREIEGVWE